MADNQVIFNADVVFDQTKIQQRFAQLEQKLKFQSPFGTMSKDVTNFNYQLDRATQRVVTLGTAFSVLSTANRLIRSIVESTVAVEKSLTSVNAIFRLTNENLGRFSSSLFDISRETASSFEKVAEAAQEFARQGLSVAETQKAVRAALLLSRDANIDVTESVRALTAATNSFSKEALSRLQIANRLASVDAAFAVSSKDLAEALIRTGSAAADAGVSFNQFIGLVTAAQQISQRGGTVIAGALNTIFTRVNRKDTLDALDSLGVAITDVRGQALPTIDVLRNFAIAYDKMTGSIKNQAAELVGGVRQLNTLKATLKDLATQGSVFKQVQDVIERNSNEIERRNAARNQTLSSLGSQASTSGQQIASNIGQGFVGPAKGLLGGLLNNPVTQALQDANGQAESTGGKVAETFLKGFGSAVIFGLGPILAKVLTSITLSVGNNLLKDVAAISGLNSQEKERLAIESQITDVYKQGGAALQQQLATMTTMTERAALIKNLLGGAGANYVPAGAIAAEIQATGGLPRRPRTRGFAGGYVPFAEEAAAINAGVGGATPGSSPVLLNGFNFGGGKVGSVVANTSEYVVPHFAGGGSAILNQNMIRSMGGVPPGARPIAAGGYVPFAAGGLPNAYEAALQRILGPANESISGMGGVLSYGPSAPSAKQWKSMGGNPADQIVKDYEKALKELAATAKEEERLAKKRLAQMEADFADQEASNKIKTKGRDLTKAEVALGEKRLTEFRAQQSEAREELSRAFAKRRSVENAPIVGGPRSVYEIRPIPDSPYGGGEYVKNKSGTYDLHYPSAQTSPAAQRPASAGNMSRTDTERIKAVYRQQMVEEKQAARQGEIIAQNKRIDRLQERLREARRPDAADPYGPFLPSGWSDPTLKSPSFRSRVSKGANSIQGQLALGIGLPFIGGMIGQGQGGTAAGIGREAASSGLQGAGFGASVGSLVPGIGTLGGAAIGGIFGALTGAISKASKSFEELSLELDQKTKKLGEELTNASEVFRIQGDLKDAILSGNEDQVIDLKKQRATAMARISNPKYLDIVNKYLENPEQGAVEVARAGNSVLGPQITQSNLVSAMARGQLSGGDIFSKIFGGQPITKQFTESGVSAVQSAIGGFSKADLLNLQKTTANDLPSALQKVGEAAGLPAEQIAEMVNRLKTPGVSRTSAVRLTKSSISGAIDNLLLREPIPASRDSGMLTRETDLIKLSSGYHNQAFNIGVTGAANAQIRQVQQQIALANPALTDASRLQLQGSQGATNIGLQTADQRKEAIARGQGDLVEIARTKGLSQAVIDRIKGANSRSGLESLATEASTPMGRGPLASLGLGDQNSPFRKTLEEVIASLKKLDKTEEEGTRVNNANNDALREQLEFLRTLQGAQAQDTGESSTLMRALEAAGMRRDSADVTNGLTSQLRSVSLRTKFRSGEINQAQLDAGLYVGGLSDNLNQTTRTNRALGRPTAEDARVGLGSDQAKADNERKRIDNSMEIRIAKNLGDEEKVRDLIVEKNALEREHNRLLGETTQTQEMIRGGIDQQNRDLEKSISFNKILLKIAKERHDEEDSINQLTLKGQDLELENQFRNGDISEGALRLGRLRNRATTAAGSQFTSGAGVSATQFSLAQEQGLQGDSQGSLTGGFKSVFAGLKRDIADFSEVGKAMADSLNNSLGNAFGDFVTGAKSAKDAFRGFAVSVLSDASRMLASKAVSSILGSFLGGTSFGGSSGGVMGFANGGTVPAMLMGGEYVVGPNAARRIGYDTLRRMNGMAEGGMVGGGSGVKDDVPARLAPGSFVLKKSATSRIGPDYMNALVAGRVQHRDIGGIILGALLGGGVGYATGGTKGAVGGALLGGIAGGLYSSNGVRMDPSTGGRAVLSVGEKAALGFGASAGAGLLAAGIGNRPSGGSGALNDSQLNGYRQNVEAAQLSAFNSRPSPFPMLQIGPQGQSYLTGYTEGPATRRWAEGGGVDVPLTVNSQEAKSGGSTGVNVKIDIHNNGSTTATSSTEGGGQGGPFQGDFANKLQKTVQSMIQQELVNQSRSDGFFAQGGRYLQR